MDKRTTLSGILRTWRHSWGIIEGENGHSYFAHQSKFVGDCPWCKRAHKCEIFVGCTVEFIEGVHARGKYSPAVEVRLTGKRASPSTLPSEPPARGTS